MRTYPVLLMVMLSMGTSGQTIEVTAHRGASGYAPENTAASVRKALGIGVDRIEVDVQQTSDGVVVVMHDRTLDRTTDMEGEMRDFTWEELQVAKANKGFEKEFPEEGIPTLESLFGLFDGSTQFVIEIKDGNETYPGIEDRVVQLIREFHAEKWALVHSFNDRVLEHLHGDYPDIRLQKLFVFKVPLLPVMLDSDLHLRSLSDYRYVEAFGVHRSFVTQGMVDRAHRLGKKVHVWTVNDTGDMQELIDMGVDGVISNYPDKMKSVIAELRSGQP